MEGWIAYLLLFLTGCVAGVVNVIAGGGSFLTLPVLMFLGLPAVTANGTNRVGILIQTVVSLRSFKKQNMLDLKGGIMLALPAIVGGIIGAQIAVNLDEQMLRKVIGALMVVMLVFILARPKRWLKGQLDVLGRRPKALELVIFFFIGAYGGFIQAGVGIFLLAGLVLGVGYDLVRANAVKVLIVLCFTAFAMVVFMINGQILWGLGLLLAVGNAGGGWLAAKLAIERGAGLVRWFLIAVVVVSAAKLLGLVDLVVNAL